MLTSLRTGSWLTPERLRVYPAILLAGFACALAYLIGTSTGLMDRFDRPLGTDFSQVWAAGREVLQGHPAMPYDNPAHAQMQRGIFGENTQFYGWHYPPFFLGLAALLSLLPYLWSLAVWQGVTLGFYLAAIGQIAAQVMPPACGEGGMPGMAGGGGQGRRSQPIPGAGANMPESSPLATPARRCAPGGGRAPAFQWLIPALAFPAVFVNLGHGHNGFLTAALLSGALLCLKQRPLLAGVMFGLLAYKPQFALIVPVALLAGGHWRSLLVAAATVSAMVLATFAAFGLETWQGFFASLEFTRKIVLEQGSTGFEKIQTVFAAIRLMGGGIELAYAAQTAATLATIAAIAWLWRSSADFRLKAAAVLTATLLTTPYALDYDMMVLGPAIALMVSLGSSRGFETFEKSLLAGVWLVPLLARGFGGAAHLPLGVLAAGTLFVVIGRRARRETRLTCASAAFA